MTYCDLWINEADYSENYIDVCCYSDISDVSIGCGVCLEASEDNLFTLDADLLECTLSESFWENSFNFEDGITKAQQLLQSGETESPQDALKIVFGEFDISFSLGAYEFNLDVALDANEIMYSLLECMI